MGVVVSDLPDRPAPPQPLAERVTSWVRWVGPGRLVGSAVVVLAVLAGAYWLVRPPAATTESKLPLAGSSAAPPGTTVAGAAPGENLSTSTVAVEELVVHVAGAVAAPGVHLLPAGARTIDAVLAAGGFSAEANPDAINLAAPVVDGQRVYVPKVGEAAPVLVDSGGSPAVTTPSGPVNLNTATADDLDSLPGVGPSTAAAILAHREQHGPFATVDELAEVRGIGPAKLEALRGLVTV